MGLISDKRKNLGHSIQMIFFNKFGDSSEFSVYSLENIENLVLNFWSLEVFIKIFLFAMAQVFHL